MWYFNGGGSTVGYFYGKHWQKSEVMTFLVIGVMWRGEVKVCLAGKILVHTNMTINLWCADLEKIESVMMQKVVFTGE